MKKLVLALAAAAAFAGQAMAADMPARVAKAPPPVLAVVYNWTGFYVGAHIGGAWSDETWCRNGSGVNGCALRVPGENYAKIDGSGVLGGLQAGYNWQTNNFVLGVEGQISVADVNGSADFRTFNSRYVAHGDINALATVAARFGVTFDRTLIYGKGGVAWIDEDRWVVNTSVPVAFAKSSDTRTGWMVGVGLEQAFSPNWSAKIEWDYMDFGTNTLTTNGAGGGGSPSPVAIDRVVQLVKVGVNYRFGGPIVARY